MNYVDIDFGMVVSSVFEYKIPYYFSSSEIFYQKNYFSRFVFWVRTTYAYVLYDYFGFVGSRDHITCLTGAANKK